MSVNPTNRGLAMRFASLCEIDREWSALAELPPDTGEDVVPTGHRLILEARIVRKFLDEPNILRSKARQTEDFRKNFAEYPLDGTEGYLLSLVTGGLTVEKILLASSLGRFRTLFGLAQLRQKGVLIFDRPATDFDETITRRPKA